MASKYEKWVNRSLYECQMFGFTSKAFLDFGILSTLTFDPFICLGSLLAIYIVLFFILAGQQYAACCKGCRLLLT